MANDWKALIGVVFDLKQAQSELDRQIKSLQKSSKLALNVDLSDKEAKKVIQSSSKMWSNYRRESVSAMTASSSELQKMKKYYIDLEKEIQKNIQIKKQSYLAEEQAYKMNQKMADSMHNIKLRADAGSKSFSAYLSKLQPQALKNYSTQINEISNAFSKAASTGDKTDYSKATASLSQFKSQMKETGMEAASLTTKLKENLQAFSTWYFLGNAIASFTRDFKQAIVTIKEVDTLLTEISKTSNLAGEELKQLGYNAFDAASKYGNTVQSYLQGYLEMSRGTDKATATGLAEMSILAQSAGDMTAELANEYIIATNAAYKLNGEVSKINAVLDSQNQISNRNQISMSKIAEATKIAGSQSAQSGVAINEMTAAISTMGVVTQAEGERLGRSWKGILMNIQQVKGETEDGEIIDSESLSKSEKAADALGVKFKEVRNGILSLRDPMQVIKELSEAYSKLPEGDVRGANLISAIGGKYRGNELSALLSNYKMYEKILGDYENASGSAASEAQKTADSIEGRLNKLTNTWNKTVANVVDSDLLKTFISMGTGAIDLADDLNLLQTTIIGLSIFGAFKGGTAFLSWIKDAIGSTMAFGNALNTVNAQGFVANTTNLGRAISGLTANQAIAVLSTQNLTSTQIQAAMVIGGFSDVEALTAANTITMATAENTATASTWSLSAAFTGLGAVIKANPIGFAITALVTLYSAVFFAINKIEEAKQKALQASIEATKAYQDEQKSIDDQISSYKELQKQLEQGNLSTEEITSIKQQLLDIQTNLITSYGDEASGIDLVNGKYKEQIDLIGELSKQKAQDYLAENKSAFEDAKDALYKNKTYNVGYLTERLNDSGGYNGDHELIDFLKSYKNDFVKFTEEDAYGYWKYSLNVEANTEDADNALHQLYNDIEDFGKQTGVDVNNTLTLISNQIGKTWTEDLQSYKDTYDEYVKAQIVANDTLRPLYQQSIQAVEDYNNAIASGKGVDEAIINLSKIQNKLRANTGLIEGAEEVFNNLFNTLISGSKESSEAIIQNFQLNNFKDIIDSLSDKIKTVSEAQKELSDTGYLNYDTVSNLLEVYPEFQKYLTATENGYITSKSALDNLIISETSQYELELQNAMAIAEEVFGAENLKAQGYNGTAESMIAAAEAQIALNEAYAKAAYYQSGLSSGLSYDQFLKIGGLNVTTNMDNALKSLNNSKANLDNVKTLINQIQTDTENGTSKKLDPIEQAFENGTNGIEGKKSLDHRLAMEEITQQQYLNGLTKINEATFGKQKDKYLDQYQQYEEEVYKGKKAIDDKFTEDIKKNEDQVINDYRDEVNGWIANYKHRFEMGEITEEQYYEWSNNINEKYFKDKEAYLDDYQKNEEAYYKWSQHQAEEQIKSQFDAVNNIIDLYREGYSEIQNLASDYESGSSEQFATLSIGVQKVTDEITYITDQIVALNQSFKDGTIDEETYKTQLESLNNALKEAHSSTQDLFDSMADSLDSDMNNLLEDLQDSYDNLTESINDNYDAYEKLVNKQKESLRANKEAADYAKEISDKTKEMQDNRSRIAELQLAANSGDREAQAEIKKLQEELSKQQEDLDKTESDHELKLEEDRLDESLENLKDITDKQLEDAKTVYDDKLAKLKSLYAEEEALIKHMSDYTQTEFATKISALNTEIQNIISQLNTTTGGNVTGGMTTGEQKIITDTQSEVASNTSTYVNNPESTSIKDAKILALLQSGTSPTGKSALNKYVHENYGSYLTYAEMVQLAKLLKVTGINDINDVEGTTNNNRNKILNALKKARFTDGGYAINNSTIKSLGEDGIALLKRGEPVLTVEQGKLFRELITNIKPLNNLVKLSTPNISNISNNNSNKNITVNFDSLLSGITVASDYDLVSGIKQNLPKVTELISKELRGLK